MNKRGQSETGKVLWELLVLILVLIVAGSVLYFLLRAFFISGDNETQATLAGFQSLSADIAKVSNTAEPFASNIQGLLPLYIAEDYVIVGFNRGKSQPIDGCGIGADEKVARPEACGETACICLYPNNGADNFESAKEDAATPISCTTFSNVDYITSFWYNDKDRLAFSPTDYVKTPDVYVKNLNGLCDLSIPVNYAVDAPPKLTMTARCPGNLERKHASFIAYGGCTAWRNLRVNWGTQLIYVEKAKTEGKTIVLISSLMDSPTLEARQQYFLKQNTPIVPEATT